MQQIYRRTHMSKYFIKIALRHGCSPVNLLHIFRTPFPQNTSGWLLSIIDTQYIHLAILNLFQTTWLCCLDHRLISNELKPVQIFIQNITITAWLIPLSSIILVLCDELGIFFWKELYIQVFFLALFYNR